MLFCMIKFECEYCGKTFYRRQNKHQRFCSNKCRAAVLPTNFLKDGHPANYNYNRIRFCKECGKPLNHCNTTGYCEEHYREFTDYKKHISVTQKLRGAGGYRFGSGGGKKGRYEDVHFDSSWELAVYIFYKDHGMFIKRCTEKRTYEFEGKIYNYIPDFVTDEGIIEIKGYDTPRSLAKAKYNPDIIVLHYEDIKEMIKYVINTYGANFYNDLYD